MKRLVIAMALTCVLPGLVSAGDVPSVGITAAVPGGRMLGPGPTSPGEIPSVGSSLEISDAALNLIQSMLGAGI